MSNLVEAIWVGPSGYTLPDGRPLEPGVTVAKLSEGEATESDNWKVGGTPTIKPQEPVVPVVAPESPVTPERK